MKPIACVLLASAMLIACDSDLIEPRHLVGVFGDAEGMPVRDQRQDWPTLEECEKRYILEVLDEVAGSRSAAAKILGIDRVSLWRKIKRHGLEHPDA